MEKGGRGVPLAAHATTQEGSNLALDGQPEVAVLLRAGADDVVIPAARLHVGGVATGNRVSGAAIRAT